MAAHGTSAEFLHACSLAPATLRNASSTQRTGGGAQSVFRRRPRDQRAASRGRDGYAAHVDRAQTDFPPVSGGFSRLVTRGPLPFRARGGHYWGDDGRSSS